jgi:precorrin-4 methylase
VERKVEEERRGREEKERVLTETSTRTCTDRDRVSRITRFLSGDAQALDFNYSTMDEQMPSLEDQKIAWDVLGVRF